MIAELFRLFHGLRELFEELAKQVKELVDVAEPAIEAISRFGLRTGRAIGRGIRRATITAHAALRNARRELEDLLFWIKCALFGLAIWLGLMILVRAYLPRWTTVEATQNVLGWMALGPILIGVALIVILIKLNYLLTFGAVKIAIRLIPEGNAARMTLDEIVANLEKVIVTAFKLTIGGLVLTGIVLYLVPLEKDPGLVLFALMLGIGKLVFRSKKLAWVLTLLLVGTIIAFFLGGRGKAIGTLVDAASAAQTKPPEIKKPGQADDQPPAKTQLPGYRKGRWCTKEKEAQDLFDETIPTRQFAYRPIDGCSAELVLPSSFNNLHFQALGADRPGDYVAFSCSDGRELFVGPLSSANSDNVRGCGGKTPRERHTIFVQGNADLAFLAP
jgi:hypothetical protein